MYISLLIFVCVQPVLNPFVYRYFQKCDDEGDEDHGTPEEKPDAYYWWHKKLGDYFAQVTNLDRKVEVLTSLSRIRIEGYLFLPCININA